MSESLSEHEVQNHKVLRAKLLVSPEDLGAAKNVVSEELAILKAQRSFVVAAVALKELTDFVPESFDSVIEKVRAESDLDGRDLVDAYFAAVLNPLETTSFDNGGEVAIAAFNPAHPNRVLLNGYDYNNVKTDADNPNEFWALADLDNPESSLDVHVVYGRDDIKERLLSQLYEQPHSNQE